jgi:hypothetical protein
MRKYESYTMMRGKTVKRVILIMLLTSVATVAGCTDDVKEQQCGPKDITVADCSVISIS